jgi:murein endopeptidase
LGGVEMIDQKVKALYPNVDRLKWYPSLYTWLEDILETEEDRELVHQMLGIKEHTEYLVMRLVKNSDDSECLTSSIDFVRDAKLFFIRRRECSKSTATTTII